MNDPLKQLLRDADASASAPLRREPANEMAGSVRRRRRREQIRNRVVTATCVIIAVSALGFSLRRSGPTSEIAQIPAPLVPEMSPPPQRIVSDIDARIAELTAQHLLASEARRRSPAPAAVNVREQSDRTALILIYEGDGYARGKRADDAIAAYQRAIELFPQSRWADVARQRLKDFAT